MNKKNVITYLVIFNLLAVLIILLSKIAFKALEDYKTQKRKGIKDPTFKASSIPELDKEITEW